MFKIKRMVPACAVVLALAALIVFGSALPVLGQGAVTPVADFGFRPDANGFSFENYGNEPGYVNLTPAELQRLFGDVACASTAGGKCVLAPEVKQLMEQWNDQMKGGHCYGFSVAALRFYAKELNPADFGAPNVAGLQITGNEKLQREIAFHFVFQTLKPVNESVIQGAPSQVLDKLIELLKPGPSAADTYTIAIFKADGTGGHAVTPFAVEDRGNGQFAIFVWDNNFPKVTKEILVDRNANTWSYYAAINPSVPLAEYTGDANTKSLSLYPTKPGLSVRQATLACPVCLAKENNRVPGLAAPVLQYNEIFLDGNPQSYAHLLITDEQGRRYGYLPDGKFVTEILGVNIQRVMLGGTTWASAPEPVYLVPVGMKFTLTIDGSLLKAPDVTDVVMIGPGYDIGIEGIQMKPGDKDTLTLSPDGSQLVYKTAGSESPTIIIGIETPGPDYEFEVKGFEMPGGGEIAINLNTAKGQLALSAKTNAKTAGTYGLWVNRIDDKGEQSFGHDNIQLNSGDTVYLDYAKWGGDKAAMSLGIDHGSDGSIDETIDLSDDN